MTHAPEAPVVVVMGVSGSGKSTLARRLAAVLGWDFQEGDELHPPANVAKMSLGVPLDDDDRGPWLDAVAGWIDAHTASGRPGVITCSALRRAYRDRLRRPEVVFVHLTGDREAIGRRLATRAGHFMPSALLESQLATLESPAPRENVLELGPDLTPAEQAAAVIELLGLRPTG